MKRTAKRKVSKKTGFKFEQKEPRSFLTSGQKIRVIDLVEAFKEEKAACLSLSVKLQGNDKFLKLNYSDIADYTLGYLNDCIDANFLEKRYVLFCNVRSDSLMFVYLSSELLLDMHSADIWGKGDLFLDLYQKMKVCKKFPTVCFPYGVYFEESGKSLVQVIDLYCNHCGKQLKRQSKKSKFMQEMLMMQGLQLTDSLAESLGKVVPLYVDTECTD